MMRYSIEKIGNIIDSKNYFKNPTINIEDIFIDSRNIVPINQSLFVSLHSERRDGHQFIENLYNLGYRNFLVNLAFNHTLFLEANFLKVSNVLEALQKIAVYHRNQFQFPIIGITGSNGKTIIKEWLYQLLSPNFNIVRSPRSYNSQIGVSLSVWKIQDIHNLGIFEAGISKYHEMVNLEKMIAPNIGILSHIGDAHSEGFTSIQDKLIEKLKLFKNAHKIIYNLDEITEILGQEINIQKELPNNIQHITWSRKIKSTLQIVEEKINSNTCTISAIYKDKKHKIEIPGTEQSLIDNAIYCWLVLLEMNISELDISNRMLMIENLDMRLQIKPGLNNSVLLDDSYSNDLDSLLIALNETYKKANQKKINLIISDISSNSNDINEINYFNLFKHIQLIKPNKLIFIGHQAKEYLSQHQQLINDFNLNFFTSTDEFLNQLHNFNFNNEFILIKGSRKYEFEKIIYQLEDKMHNAIMEIDLEIIIKNLHTFQAIVQPNTKIICVLKAFGYGSGSIELAKLLQQEQTAYIAVAYIDEAIELRKAGIHIPIILMNLEVLNFWQIVQYKLEPEIYSIEMFFQFFNFAKKNGLQDFPIHLKFNTGMNRVGLEFDDIDHLCQALTTNNYFRLISVFSHLAEASNQDFSNKQFLNFQRICDSIKTKINYPFFKHILSSMGIPKYPQAHFDFVRLGIGLYGIQKDKLNLENPFYLYSKITQIKQLEKGDNIGYGCTTILDKPTRIATVLIGYADGYKRCFGNGTASMFVRNQFAPTIGNINMDLTMIDITNIPNVQIGDEVEVFGSHIKLAQLAQLANTIEYEILTGIGKRIKRVYLHG